jgi:hypothetical protein
MKNSVKLASKKLTLLFLIFGFFFLNLVSASVGDFSTCKNITPLKYGFYKEVRIDDCYKLEYDPSILILIQTSKPNDKDKPIIIYE